jgi:hypothetical protein
MLNYRAFVAADLFRYHAKRNTLNRSPLPPFILKYKGVTQGTMPKLVLPVTN